MFRGAGMGQESCIHACTGGPERPAGLNFGQIPNVLLTCHKLQYWYISTLADQARYIHTGSFLPEQSEQTPENIRSIESPHPTQATVARSCS